MATTVQTPWPPAEPWNAALQVLEAYSQALRDAYWSWSQHTKALHEQCKQPEQACKGYEVYNVHRL